jgi:hypothetical protein
LKRGFLAAALLIVSLSVTLPDSTTLNHAKLIACTVVVTLTILERRNVGVVVQLVVLIAMMGVVSAGRARLAGIVLQSERSFFGVHRVLEAQDGSHRMLYHGSTLHGWQALPAAGCEPSSYYSRKGPIGDVFAKAAGRFERVAAVGLGIGALACYARPGDAWTFYEIDAVVKRLATNPLYFNQISNSAGTVAVVVADGRLGLQGAAPGSYDLLILDAFSSDAIPVHLLTREAMELYFSRLARDGIVAIHVSNRYLRLDPALAALCRDLGLHCYARGDGAVPSEDARHGRTSSRWVVLAREPEDVLGLDQMKGWGRLQQTPTVRVWTDDYSNVPEALLLRYGLH